MKVETWEMHKCQALPEELEIVFDNFFDEGYKWCLLWAQNVTDEDMEITTWESTDEIKEQVFIPILCCPFCGENLYGQKPEKISNFEIRQFKYDW